MKNIFLCYDLEEKKWQILMCLCIQEELVIFLSRPITCDSLFVNFFNC